MVNQYATSTEISGFEAVSSRDQATLHFAGLQNWLQCLVLAGLMHQWKLLGQVLAILDGSLGAVDLSG